MKFDAAKVKKQKGLSPATRAVFAGAKLDDVDLATLDLEALAACSTEKPSTKKLRSTRVTKLLFHHGNLHVTGNLEVLEPLVVTGDVTVSGLASNTGPVYIGGNLTCGSLVTEGEMSCNAITAKGLVLGYGNDFTLHCGAIRALVVIQDDHDMDHAGIKAKLNLDTDTFNGGYGALTKLKKFFKPRFFTVDEDELDDDGNPMAMLDLTAVGYAISKGRDPFVRT